MQASLKGLAVIIGESYFIEWVEESNHDLAWQRERCAS
jgi:hypothetical protein